MSIKAKELVIFDLDGTLVDSVPDLAASLNHALETAGRATFAEDTIREWVGNGAKTLVMRALTYKEPADAKESALFEKTLADFLEHYSKNLCVKSTLYPGAVELLIELKSLGFKTAIATNKPEPFVEPLLEELKIAHLFDEIAGAETAPYKKPHPAPILHICEALKTPVEKTVMVGDSKNDILAAKSANVVSVAVKHGYNYGEDIALCGPDFIIDDLTELVDILEAANGR